MAKTVTEFLRERLLAGVPRRVPGLEELRGLERSPEFERLRGLERSPEFERLRKNRKVIGAMRYGLMGEAGKPKYDRVACMLRRLEAYRVDRNAEHLVDVANLAELEFVEGEHRGVIAQDDGPHTAAVG